MTTTITEVRASALVAEEVRAELGRQGLSKRQLALRLGANTTWLYARIGPNATVDITLDEVLRMAQALDVPVERLLRDVLPRLDSNQQPSGYRPDLVSVPALGLRSAWELVA